MQMVKPSLRAIDCRQADRRTWPQPHQNDRCGRSGRILERQVAIKREASAENVSILQKLESDAPVLLRVDLRAGHGAGKPTAKQLEETADIYAFVWKSLGME